MSAGEFLRRVRDQFHEIEVDAVRWQAELDEAIRVADRVDDQRIAVEEYQANVRQLHGELRAVKGDGAA